MSLPPWVKSATEPTPEELAQFHSDVAPPVLRAVRASTEPSLGEVARIRPRLARRRVAIGWVAVPVAVAFGLAIGRGATPEIPAVQVEDAGLYLVSPGQWVTSVAGVRASGDGVLRVVPGALRVDGALHLEIAGPVVLETSLARFTTHSAVLDIDVSDRVTVTSGEVGAPGGVVLRAGDRWPPPPVVEVAVVAPSVPEPRARVVAPIAAPVAPSEVAPPVAPGPPPEIAAWRDVLTALEAGAPPADRARLCAEFAELWPDSPLAREARALALLARAEFEPGEAVLEALEASLAAAPKGPRAMELHARAAWLAREKLGDCVRAGPHDRALVAAGGAAGERARALLASCEEVP